jgi:hypothetical protein
LIGAAAGVRPAGALVVGRAAGPTQGVNAGANLIGAATGEGTTATGAVGLVLTGLAGFVDGANSGDIVGAAGDGALGAVGIPPLTGLVDRVGGAMLWGETIGRGVGIGAVVTGLLDGIVGKNGFSVVLLRLPVDDTTQIVIEVTTVNAANAHNHPYQPWSVDRLVWNPRDAYGSSLALLVWGLRRVMESR